MGRGKKKRCCRYLADKQIFKPIGVPMQELETVTLQADEFEALRLCDLENKNQIEAGEEMHISRGTVQRILSSGRGKIVRALLYSQAIGIENDDI